MWTVEWKDRILSFIFLHRVNSALFFVRMSSVSICIFFPLSADLRGCWPAPGPPRHPPAHQAALLLPALVSAKQLKFGPICQINIASFFSSAVTTTFWPSGCITSLRRTMTSTSRCCRRRGEQIVYGDVRQFRGSFLVIYGSFAAIAAVLRQFLVIYGSITAVSRVYP